MSGGCCCQLATRNPQSATRDTGVTGCRNLRLKLTICSSEAWRPMTAANPTSGPDCYPCGSPSFWRGRVSTFVDGFRFPGSGGSSKCPTVPPVSADHRGCQDLLLKNWTLDMNQEGNHQVTTTSSCMRLEPLPQRPSSRRCSEVFFSFLWGKKFDGIRYGQRRPERAYLCALT